MGGELIKRRERSLQDTKQDRGARVGVRRSIRSLNGVSPAQQFPSHSSISGTRHSGLGPRADFSVPLTDKNKNRLEMVGCHFPAFGALDDCGVRTSTISNRGSLPTFNVPVVEISFRAVSVAATILSNGTFSFPLPRDSSINSMFSNFV
jgi:hypothetical protein